MRTGKLMAALMIGMVLTSVNSHPAQAKNSAARAAVYEKSRSDEIQKTETQEKETGKIELQKIGPQEGGNTEDWESGGGGDKRCVGAWERNHTGAVTDAGTASATGSSPGDGKSG